MQYGKTDKTNRNIAIWATYVSVVFISLAVLESLLQVLAVHQKISYCLKQTGVKPRSEHDLQRAGKWRTTVPAGSAFMPESS